MYGNASISILLIPLPIECTYISPVVEECENNICDRTTTNCIKTIDDFVCVCLIGFRRLNSTHCEGKRKTLYILNQ